MEHIFTLFFHFIGLGLLVTTMTAGFILNNHYKKAGDYQTKGIILRSMKPLGMLSPLASVLLLITGIGNMHVLGYSALDLPGWLAYKIVFYAIAVISGVLFGIKSRKRGALVGQILAGKAPADAETTLKGLDQQISLFYPVFALLFTIIVLLAIHGRLGAQ